MSREELMRHIQQAGFALTDTGLFLNSHPQNQMALDYFADVQRQYTQLQAEYEMMYGPLTAFDSNTEQGWTWLQSPWPWESEV